MSKVPDSDVKPLVTGSRNSSSVDQQGEASLGTTAVKIRVDNGASTKAIAGDEIKKIVHLEVQDNLEQIAGEIELRDCSRVSNTRYKQKALGACQLEEENAKRRLSVVFPKCSAACSPAPEQLERYLKKTTTMKTK